jgi:NADH-quinone oxidoreductase subunit J
VSGGETALFWVMAPVMVAGALGLLFAKKAVHAALCMALVMIGLGVVYFGLEAPFLGGVQVFVYTGAVMMIFLFVLMLIGVDSSDSLIETIKGQRVAAVLFGLGIVVLLLSVLSGVVFGVPVTMAQVNADGNIASIAASIFGSYVWAFEATGALLITAALGAMVLAHRERLVPKASQKELSQRRIRDGAIKAPLPAPGVFARHNAVDTPALLPDGTPSELSVSRVLTARGQNLSATDRAGEIRVIDAEMTSPLSVEGDPAVSEPADGELADGELADGSPAGATPEGERA